MSRIVRSSKYRHVFADAPKKEVCFDELKPSKTAWDANYVYANPVYWALSWDSGGGGSFAVGDLKKPGKWNPNAPLIAGHKSAVQDLDFHPFNDSLIASVAEDGLGKIWKIPDGGLTTTMTEAAQTLTGHKRKVGNVKFNPIANNVLATAGSDMAVKVWDVEKGDTKLSSEGEHGDIIISMDWNWDGSLLATLSKDKKLRIIDPRAKKITADVEAHTGVKGGRVIWLGNKDKVFTVGFTKTSEREYGIWDPKDLSKPMAKAVLDNASGVIMPFYDNDTAVLFLAGKGDGNVRYYEIVDETPYMHFLAEFKSSTPARGMAFLPKRAVDVPACEIGKALKLTTKTLEPLSFVVPRKSEMFQDDIFPDCISGESTLSSEEWFGGKNGQPKTRPMNVGFVAREKPADFNPVAKEAEKEMSPAELKAEVERLSNRVSYLEAELVKRDAKIKELGN